jgi:hypothetical protein
MNPQEHTMTDMDAARWMFAAGLTFLCACSGGGDTYTLYRASPLDDTARIQMATFDAKERGTYNEENCWLTAKLFMSQPGVTVRYWCEKGRYRP